MQDAEERQRIAALEARIAAAKKAHATEAPRQDDHYSAANVAWRMVTELVAGLGIGFGIGYGLDALFGTLPWLMVVFTLIGLAAGIQTMLRTAREIEQAGSNPPPRRRRGGADQTETGRSTAPAPTKTDGKTGKDTAGEQHGD